MGNLLQAQHHGNWFPGFPSRTNYRGAQSRGVFDLFCYVKLFGANLLGEAGPESEDLFDQRHPLRLRILPRFEAVEISAGCYPSSGIVAAVPDGFIAALSDDITVNQYPHQTT